MGTGGYLKPGRRLQRENFWRVLKDRYGVKPHGLRHAAITAALVATNGDIAKVRLFSRHISMDVIRFYDDRRRDSAGEIAGLLDGLA
jgi:integrase